MVMLRLDIYPFKRAGPVSETDHTGIHLLEEVREMPRFCASTVDPERRGPTRHQGAPARRARIVATPRAGFRSEPAVARGQGGADWTWGAGLAGIPSGRS